MRQKQQNRSLCDVAQRNSAPKDIQGSIPKNLTWPRDSANTMIVVAHAGSLPEFSGGSEM